MSDRGSLGGSGPLTPPQGHRVLDTAVDPFCLINGAGRVLWAGASVVEVLGIAAEQLVGRSLFDLVAPESMDDALQSLASAVDHARGRQGVSSWDGAGPAVTFRRPDGGTATCSIAVATSARTGLPGLMLQLRRVDAAHAMENALVAMAQGRPVEEVLAQVAAMLAGELPESEVAVFLRPRPYRDLRLVSGPEELAGLAKATLLEEAPWADALAAPGTMADGKVDDLPRPLAEAAQARGHSRVTVVAVPPSGDGPPPALVAVWSRQDLMPYGFNVDRVQRCADIVGLVVRWYEGRRVLEWTATHDVLTGLHNRSSFFDRVRSVDDRRTPDAGCVAVFYLDLDDFKPVNDVHGHSTGDRVLVEVAARVRRCVRPGDLVARLGGDEFALLCPGLDDMAAAEALAQRLVHAVGQPIEVGGIEVQIGLSIGVAALLEGEDVEGVLLRADAALRDAKGAGKRRWRLA